MKAIPLTQGKVACVSDHRYEWAMQWKWSASKSKSGKWYAVRRGKNGRQLKMHREIMGVTDPKIEIDHRDRDGLNNQDYNLRVCTHAQNLSNASPRKNKTGFTGVVPHGRGYRAYIRKNKKMIYIDGFTTPGAAARARDRLAKEHFGEFAYLNFPEGSQE